MELAVRTTDLTKYYGKVLAVDHVDLEVGRGEFFGLLGPNGAGKTTTIRMLTGLTKPTSGKVMIAGFELASNPVEAKKRIGITPEISNLYDEMTAWNNLMFAAELYGVSKAERAQRAKELLEIFGLYDRRNSKVGGFSKGMRRRLTIAASLVHNPEILFLDEPTIGLDVRSSGSIRSLIRKLNEKGTTVFLTTHYIEEADQLCQRVAIINQGKIVAVDRPENLKAAVREERVVEVSFDRFPRGIEDKIRRINYVRDVVKRGDKLRLYTTDFAGLAPLLVDFATTNGLRIVSMNTLRTTLEEVFVKLTGLGPLEAERMELMRPAKGGGRG